MIETLNQIGIRHGTDQSSLFHGYLGRLDPYLGPIRASAKKVLEIGVAGGASIKTWRDYFPYATIFGVDHNINSIGLDLGPMVQLLHGEASDPLFWMKFEQMWLHDGVFLDWACDDASHHSSQIITTFECIWPFIARGGLYVCQDLHSAYDPAYNRDGGPNAVNFFKGLIDYHVNENGDNNCGQQSVGDMEFIHFYKSLVIIKKR